MKLRWHCLFVLLAFVTAVIYGFWPAKPLWVSSRQDIIHFAGKDPVHHEVFSLICKDDGQSWYLETRDYRNGGVLRKMKLLVPEFKGDSHFIRTGNNQITHKQALVFCNSWREQVSSGGMKVFEECWLLDPSTGELLHNQPFMIQPMGGGFAQQGDHLALATGDGIRLIAGKNQSGRDIAIKGVFNLVMSPDGQTNGT